MRRSLGATLLIAATAVPLAISGSMLHGYAQVSGPQESEFNYPGLVDPFTAQCSTFAHAPCPDAQSATTWSVDDGGSGMLRIWTQFGSILGTSAASSNNARNLILQPYNPNTDFTATTKMTFPAIATTSAALGQTAGMIAYVNEDNFIFVGRVFNAGTAPQLEFLQELNGNDVATVVPETQNFLNNTVYLRLTKVGAQYTASYSYDNVTFTSITAAPAATPTPAATATATPAATATATTIPPYYTLAPGTTTPQIGLFAFGGTNAAVTQNQIPADFDWFRIGANSQTPGPVVTATATVPATTTATAVPATATATTVPPTATAVPTATATVLPTATAAPTATSTPVPTPTPIVITPYRPAFRYVSIWYHYVRRGTVEHIVIQANRHTKFGIWVHVYFPSGVSVAFFQNTDSRGHWSAAFPVPGNAWSRYSKKAVVTLQLWHGKQTVKDFTSFTVI